MTDTFVDISMPLHAGMTHWPSDPPMWIEMLKRPRKGDPWTVSFLHLGSHSGTHVDAPRHLLPGMPGADRIPLDYLIGPCQVVDCRRLAFIGLSAVKGLDVKAAPRVLFRTDNSRRIRNEGFIEDYVALDADAACWLIKRGAVLIGIDGLSIDAYGRALPAAHLTILKAGKVVLEGLDLSRAPAGFYELICLPLRVRCADGAPARALLRRRSA